MKVASYNVNSIRARLPVVLAWLRRRRPDVLAMQKTKVRDESFPHAAFEEAGQYTYWDYRMKDSFRRNHGWRLDHILATRPMAEKCTACYIDVEPRLAPGPSDHTPIVAEFDR